jgi:hypothetical protein
MVFIDKIDPDRKKLFWYDLSEPFGIIYRDYNLAAFLWEERLINEQLPFVNVPDPDWHGPKHIHVKEGQNIIIITNFKDDKLKKLTETLASENLRYEIIFESKFDSGPFSFDIIEIQLKSLKNQR